MESFRKLFQNAAFSAGFFVTGAIFFLLNLVPHPQPKSMFSNTLLETGFPFVNHKLFCGGACYSEFIRLNLIADSLIGIVLCFAAGFLWQSISESFAHHREIKKIKAEAKTVK